MSILEIVIYGLLTTTILTLMTFSLIDQVREKKGKPKLFFKKKKGEDE